MGKKPNKILAGAREALAVARGQKKAARITTEGYALFRDNEFHSICARFEASLGHPAHQDHHTHVIRALT